MFKPQHLELEYALRVIIQIIIIFLSHVAINSHIPAISEFLNNFLI